MGDDRDRIAMPTHDPAELAEQVRAALAGQAENSASLQAGRICEHVKSNGDRCGAYSQHGSRFCFHHDPAKQAERAAARARGGRARATKGRALGPFEISAVADWLPILEAVTNDVCAHETRAIQRARAVATLARAYYDLTLGSELESRVAALEARENAN